MKIALIAGGAADEHEVSRNSAANVKQALGDHDVVSVVIDKDLTLWNVGEKSLTPAQALHFLQSEVDVALPMLHGLFGEDGIIQGALEATGIPYTGSDVAASALAIDKFTASLVAHEAGLQMPRTIAIHRKQPTEELDMEFPVIIKPRTGGSTVGVSICEDTEQLRNRIENSNYEELIIQQVIVGREFTCGVIEMSDGQLQPLPPSEVIIDGLFDYEAKYNEDSFAQEITPPDVTANECSLIQSAAITAHNALGCNGITRSDFILDNDNGLFYIETNTCPGMTKRSFIPAEIKEAGLKMSDILTEQCKIAIDR